MGLLTSKRQCKLLCHDRHSAIMGSHGSFASAFALLREVLGVIMCFAEQI